MMMTKAANQDFKLPNGNAMMAQLSRKAILLANLLKNGKILLGNHVKADVMKIKANAE